MRRTSALAIVLLLSATAATSAAAVQAPGAKTAASSDTHVVRRPVGVRAARALGPTGEMRGMALNDGVQGRVLESTIADFPRLAAEGVTSVAVYVYLYVDSPTGSTVSTGTLTPTDPELQLVAQAAQLNGLGLQLAPVLLDHATNTWRGNYRPDDLGAFFASYTPQVLRYADLAQSLGATLVYVGSENRFLEPATARWKTLIAATRKHYSGALAYLAIPESAHQVKFWDSLDLAAISPYFSLGVDALPSYDRIVRAWREVNLPAIQKIAKSTRTPLVYGEVGYNSQKGAFTYPAFSATLTGTPAPAAQADAYRALLDVLAQTPWVYGVTWWRWATGTTLADVTFSPSGKPAECQIALHWSQDANVRALASLPVCDLHPLDATLGGVPLPVIKR